LKINKNIKKKIKKIKTEIKIANKKRTSLYIFGRGERGKEKASR
jgi:hypothetical protein